MAMIFRQLVSKTRNGVPDFDVHLLESGPRGKPKRKDSEPITDLEITQLRDEFFGTMKPQLLNRILVRANEEGWTYQRTEKELSAQTWDS